MKYKGQLGSFPQWGQWTSWVWVWGTVQVKGSFKGQTYNAGKKWVWITHPGWKSNFHLKVITAYTAFGS